MRRETRIQAGARHHDAKAIGSDQPHAVFLCGAFGGFRQRPCAVAKSGRDDQGTRCSPFARLIDQIGNRGGRSRHHHEFRHERQFVEAVDRGDAADGGIM